MIKTIVILLSLCWGFESRAQADSLFTKTYAEFPGGTAAMNALMKQQITYPQEAKELGIQGKCYLRFVVEADGSLSNIKVVRGVPDCPECDREAVRFMKNLPAWIPATENGKPVPCTMQTPIIFTLQ